MSTTKPARMAYLANDFKHLDDLYVADLDGSERTPAHAPERSAVVATSSSPPVERMHYKSADGWDVDGFLVKPVGWEPGKKYPLILSIHGGPAGQYGVDWYHEFQVYAAQGWAVFFYQSARLDRLRPEVRARHRERMGRQGLRRCDERRGRGARDNIRGSTAIGWA